MILFCMGFDFVVTNSLFKAISSAIAHIKGLDKTALLISVDHDNSKILYSAIVGKV